MTAFCNIVLDYYVCLWYNHNVIFWVIKRKEEVYEKDTKITSFIISVIMLMQLMAVNVFAQALTAYWGQDADDTEYSWLTGEAVFWQRADITNFEFKLYKDNTEVYSNRIEEGSWGDETEGDWLGESIFLPKFSEYGSGTYKFTVSSLTGDGGDIDEAEIIETAESGTFNYTKPSSKLAVPTIVSNSDGVIDWEKSDENTYAYMFDRVVDYGNGVTYDPDYEDTYCEDEWQSEYGIDQMLDALVYMDENYDGQYPIEDAQVKIRVRAMPEDITEYNPSDYSDWYTIDYTYTPDDGDEPTQAPADVDRTVVSESYYDAAKVVYDLGVMPDVYTNYAKNVTRGDMAVILTKIMGLTDTAEDFKDTEKFTDVEMGTELNGCIYAVCMYGYMAGVTSTTFEPDTEMTYQDIIKILVTVTGYEPIASNYGGYPLGYVYAAASKGINQNVNLNYTSTVTYEQFAQLIYNSITLGMMKQTNFYPAVYEVTNDTLLYKKLGYGKLLANVTFVDDETAKVSGMLYNKDNVNGKKVKDMTVKIKDTDILEYEKDSMMLFVDGDTVLSGLEYMGGILILNNGETTTKKRVVPVEVVGIGYTKYKLNEAEEYKPITDETAYYLLSEKNGSQTVYAYLANDDETAKATVSGKVTHDNMHTVTYMVNGSVYKTSEVGCGGAISTYYIPTAEGYEFSRWMNVPSTMPDKDIIITAKMLPSDTVTYTGKITFNGEPVQAKVSVNGTLGSKYAYSDSTTGEFSLTHTQNEAMLVVTYNVGSKYYYQSINVDGSNTDLGEIKLTPLSVCVRGTDVVKLDFEKYLTEEDYEYANTEGNSLTFEFRAQEIDTGGNSVISSTYLKTNYPDYSECKAMTFMMGKFKYGAESTAESIEFDGLLEFKIEIPQAYRDMAEYKFFRASTKDSMDGEEITTTPNADGEYIEVGERTITLHIKKMCCYALLAKGEKTDANKYIATVSQTELDTVNVAVELPETVSENAELYLAFYDEDGALIKVCKKSDFEENNSFESDYNTADIKAFIWNGLTPLS